MVNSAIEIARNEKKLGSSLEARIIIQTDEQNIIDLIENINMQEICIVSSIVHIKKNMQTDKGFLASYTNKDTDLKVFIYKTSYYKCSRCWQYKKEVNINNDLCDRCKSVIFDLK